MNSKILLGAAIGGVIGYLIGDHIAALVAPEYYTDEEIEEMLETNEKIIEENDYHIKSIKPVKTISDLRKEKEMGKKKDYTKHFVGENKEPLEKLVMKYNEGDILEEDEEIEKDFYEDAEKILRGDPNEDEPEGVLYGEDLIDNRDKTKPYLLTREEWDDNDSGFEQVRLHYYEEDDVLTDVKDRPIRSVEKLIGSDALDNFGIFSDDKYIVFVCNPIKEVEYEIIRTPKAYADVVLKTPKRVTKNNVFKERDAGKMEEVDESS